MAKSPKNEIDEELVKSLTQLLEKNNLTDIEYGRDGWHIELMLHKNSSNKVKMRRRPTRRVSKCRSTETAVNRGESDGCRTLSFCS